MLRMSASNLRSRNKLPSVRPAPGAHLGDLELRELADELVRRRIDRSSSRVADDERLGSAQTMEGGEGRSMDRCCLRLAAFAPISQSSE